MHIQKHIIVAIAIIFFPTVSAAQYMTLEEVLERFPDNYVYEGIYRCSPPIFRHCNIIDRQEIDQSHIKVIYDAKIVVDTLSSTRYQDRMIVLAGDNWYHSFGEGIWKKDMGFSFPEGSPEERQYELEKGYHEILPSFVYRDINGKKIVNRCHIPEFGRIFFRYDEPQQEFLWKLKDSSRVIAGYMCQKAVTRYAGREWTVWFTPEIPVDCGLWKFSGLPGLILEACDSRMEYEFNVLEIEQKDEPIYVYVTPEKKLSRKEFRKTEQNVYDHPILYSKGKNGYVRMHKMRQDMTGKEIFTANNFVYAYNPMELE